MNSRRLFLLFATTLVIAACNRSEPPAPVPPPPPATQPTGMPPGHPPIDTGTQTLPAGHPAIGGSSTALPAGHPPVEMSSQALPADAKAAVGTPQWKVPAGWTEAPAMSMRVATFKMTGAEVAVSAFPGDVGGPLANINRWRAQLGLGEIRQGDVAGISSPIAAGDSEGTLVSIDAGAKRMLVVTIPHAGNSWFFKMTGDAPVVETQKEAFLGFVKSVKF
jgi:hypothetical protein